MSQQVTIPAKKSHRHLACVAAGDCSVKGWCFGQTCELLPHSIGYVTGGGARTAADRCVVCRRRLRREEKQVAQADLPTRHPEGFSMSGMAW